jgi:GT2 family glycosyltransferase
LTDASDQADDDSDSPSGSDDTGGEDMESLLFETVGQQGPAATPRRAAPVSAPLPPPAPVPAAVVAPPPIVVSTIEFGEEAYCEAYPDIHAAINDGILDSAAAHFRRHGRKEQRLTSAVYLNALTGGIPEFPAQGAAFSVDAVIISQSGTVLVVGWTDDRTRPLRSISIIRGNEGSNTRAIGRCRRPDVDSLLNAPPGFGFGLWLVFKLELLESKGSTVIVRARMADGSFEQREVQANLVSDADLRETILGHFAALEYYGNRDIEAFSNLETGLGQALATFNRSISGALTSVAHAEYYGPRRSSYKASLIICLFGKVEYFFLQNALFASTIGIEDYEFIYVSNSPELAETLHKEARVAEHIYGLSITLVTLPGNAGFSAANNVAARFSRSDRVIFMNPDVFPRDRHWAQKHAALIETLPREHTAMFGAPLYYDDGSLMHGGMFFEIDQGLSVKTSGISTHGMVRVEHYGKGAPVWSDKYTRSRPVPAVTGAFISADREWFQALGGFTEDYVFGHYEDADLCLKSLRQGVPVWMHDIRFWHLEGKGSVRRPPHEGGSLVNRWLFTRRWGKMIKESLVGRTPTHPLLNIETRGAGGPSASAQPGDDPDLGPSSVDRDAGQRVARETSLNGGIPMRSRRVGRAVGDRHG